MISQTDAFLVANQPRFGFAPTTRQNNRKTESAFGQKTIANYLSALDNSENVENIH